MIAMSLVMIMIVIALSWLYLSTDKELRQIQTDSREELPRYGVAVYFGDKTTESFELVAEIISKLNANELTQIKNQHKREYGLELVLSSGVRCYIFDHWRGIEGALPPIQPASIFVDSTLSAVEMGRIISQIGYCDEIYYY